MIRGLGRNIKILCQISQTSKSGYYKWLINADKKEKDNEDYLLVKDIFDKGRGKYGWRTIQMRLESDKGIVMNHKKIQRIKNKYELFTKIRKPNPYKNIMKKNQEHRTFSNVLDRNFKQIVPCKIFGTDITYLPFNHQMAYLSVVKDMASREITAWSLSQHMEMSIVLDTIDSMTKNPSVALLPGALIHSDQGVHYTNPDYINAIKKLNMVQSMSRKGRCIDNAPTESFFGHLKDDVDYGDCKTFQELRDMIRLYIEYYNNDRPQWELKKMTPVGYRNHLLTKV